LTPTDGDCSKRLLVGTEYLHTSLSRLTGRRRAIVVVIEMIGLIRITAPPIGSAFIALRHGCGLRLDLGGRASDAERC
jgi:hypothetical protein